MATQKRCPQCRQPAPIHAQFCGGCGHTFRTQFPDADRTTAITSPTVSMPQPSGYSQAMAAEPISSSAVAAMILGLLAFFTCWFPWVGLPLAILAVALAALGINAPGRGMAIAGLTLGVLALIVSVLTATAWLSLSAFLNSLQRHEPPRRAPYYQGQEWGQTY